MKGVTILAGSAALAGLVFVAWAAAPAVSGQSARAGTPPNAAGDLQSFWAGSHLGISVRELEPTENKGEGGVYVEDVRPGSPAEKGGLARGDVITRFDGEGVRSVRQFSRLVRETPAGRTVNTTVVREGRSTELSLVPEAGTRAGIFSDGGRWPGGLPFDLDFDFPVDGTFGGLLGRARLGVTLDELTPQLAGYFGVKDGVLVSSVAEDSPASRGGLQAGDVIVSVGGDTVTSAADVLRGLRGVAADAEVALGIVRGKKETSVKVKLEAGTRRPVRTVRPMRATPA